MTTWKNFWRRGKDTLLKDVESHTFEDVAAEKDKTVAELVFSPELTDQAYANETKNSTTFTNESKSAAPTFTNETKN